MDLTGEMVLSHLASGHSGEFIRDARSARPSVTDSAASPSSAVGARPATPTG